MKMIYTACTGRCGQNSLGAYFNRFGRACVAENEPPDLIYKQHWPLGSWMRLAQRKWIVTHEDMGRGKALGWFDNDEQEPMRRLVRKRLRRAERVARRHGAGTYVELSKFFIRSYCDETFRQRPDMGVILLRRDPLMNARSFANRNKNFALDGVMPHFRKACFPLDAAALSLFQLYLWQWVEIELRYQRFVEQTGVARHRVMRTEDLNDVHKVRELFVFFGVQEREPLTPLKPVNTNVSQGRKPTRVSDGDLEEFKRFADMIPQPLMDRVPYILDYLPEERA